EVDANRELLGLGAANLGAGLSSGMVVNGSLSKTAVNGAAGARSQVSGLVVVVLTVVTLLFLTGLFENLPEATLAAVVIAAVIELVDVPALTALYRMANRQLRGIYGIAARPDFYAAVAALAGVLVFDTLPGLFIGIAVSLLLLYRASRPHVAVLGQVPGTSHSGWGTSGASGSRRTSISSRPRAWIWSSSPYRAAWSWTGPWITVSTGSTDARMPSKAAISESLRRPLTRIS
ncbi:MAG TPA: SulP family inorganic anion transporter, partial [Actinomycetota bacterium]|nr:SulP family inorganic anion transporter [Actinomycetota bacterium]